MKKIYKLELADYYYNINLEHISIILPLVTGDTDIKDSLNRSSYHIGEFCIPLNVIGNITYIRIPLTNDESTEFSDANYMNTPLKEFKKYKDRCDKIWSDLNQTYMKYHQPSKGFNFGPG